MTLENKKYIKENRLKQSMVDMGKELNISYDKVRNHMIDNGLTLSSEEINVIKQAKRKFNKNKTRKWDWNALP